jgi:WD40 repeat protein
LIALVAVAVFAAGGLLRGLGSGGDARNSDLSAESGIQVEFVDHPGDSARDALAAAHSDDSVAAELAMLEVALDGKGIERTVDTGDGEATAALVLEGHLLTASSDGGVEVWRRANGALLGQAKASAPIVALADAYVSSSFLAALDEAGAVELVDIADPGRPRVLRLGPRLAKGERPLAVAFSEDDPREVVAVGSGGEVLHVDMTTGALVSRDSLGKFQGPLPWRHGDTPLSLTAAKFVPEVYEDEEGLLVAVANGAVADVDLKEGQGKTVLDSGVAPGRILAIDRLPYGETELAVGATGGSVVVGENDFGEPSGKPGPPVPAVALESDDGLWLGESEGMALPEMEGPLSGPPVRGFDVGLHGIAALNQNGMVSALGPAGVGISMADVEGTAAAAFDPAGRLLVASGYDPNHVEEIRAVRPQQPLPYDEYQEDDELQAYKPDPEWWSEAEDPEAFYVNDVAGNDEYVIAAGQDPNQDAAVVVWDAASGKPLQELVLGTGGVSTETPSIVSKVLLLPGRHEIAAYSVAQELIAVWSTETWELEDSIPVGAVGDVSVSPDESTIAVVGLGDDPEFTVEPDEPIDISFVDLDAGKVDHVERVRGAVAAAFSPDGETLAVADQSGFLQLRSSDGSDRQGDPIELDNTPKELSWRPDGKLIAVAVSEGGVVFVDPESREVSQSLPYSTATPALGLDWSADGTLLATQTAEYDEDVERYEPAWTKVWTLGAAALEHRMCELAGCSRRRDAAAGQLDDASRLKDVALVFRHEGDLVAADSAGNTARIGRLEDFSSPSPAYAWSRLGFAWSSPQQVSAILASDERPRSWPCACAGVAWDGEEIVSLASDGSSLVRIDPADGSLRTTPVRGLTRFYPNLLGLIGGRPIVAAFGREPDRSTFNELFEIGQDGVARELSHNAHGVVNGNWPSASPSKLAFVSGLSSGVCYSTANVVVVSARPDDEIALEVAPAPLGDEPARVRSLQVAADGSVSAAISSIGCDDSGSVEEQDPLAERYLLVGHRWRPTGETGLDVQDAGGVRAVLGIGEKRDDPGPLSLVSGGQRIELAPEAEGLVGRP